MPTTVTNPKATIADAVRFVRDSRHHSNCNCFSFRDANREAFCTAQEALWTKAIARLIDECL